MNKETKINREDIISGIQNEIGKKDGITRENIGLILDALTEVITKALCDDKVVNLFGFGNFEARKRSAKNAAHPSTGKKIIVPAHKLPYFNPSASLKDAVNGRI